MHPSCRTTNIHTGTQMEGMCVSTQAHARESRGHACFELHACRRACVCVPKCSVPSHPGSSSQSDTPLQLSRDDPLQDRHQRRASATCIWDPLGTQLRLCTCPDLCTCHCMSCSLCGCSSLLNREASLCDTGYFSGSMCISGRTSMYLHEHIFL